VTAIAGNVLNHCRIPKAGVLAVVDALGRFFSGRLRNL
jgi:hypothetical protein